MARKKTVESDKIVVRVLGGTEIRVGSKSIGMKTEALFALALYLTTRAGERITREELLDTFWPEGEEEDRRHAMRQMFYRLRQMGINPSPEGDGVRLPTEMVDSDLRLALGQSWLPNFDERRLTATPGLAPVFSARLAPGFHAWYDSIRDVLSANFRHAAQGLIVAARRDARWSDMERLCLTVLSSDPLNEEAVMARAECVAMAGSKLKALEILDEYLDEVRSFSPTLGHPAEVLRKRIAERRADWGSRGPREAQLVGRTAEMRALTGLVDGTSKGSHHPYRLIGPAGIGKSRLLAEVHEYAVLRGCRVVQATAEPIMADAPLSLYRALLSQLLDTPGAAGTDPQAMALLNRLINEPEPALDEISSPRLSPLRGIADAGNSLVKAISSEVRLLVSIDDLQWADEASLQLISALERSSIGTRVCVVSASRFSDRTAHQTFCKESPATVHAVSALSATDSEKLAQQLTVFLPASPDPNETRLVAQVSGGNPLFIRELTFSQNPQGAGSPVPETINTVIQGRLHSLPDASVRLLRLTCLLGDDATVSRLKRICRIDHTDIQVTLEQLTNEGIISARDSGSVFLHDTWRQVVVAGTPRTVEIALALECAEDLLRDSPPPSSPQSTRAAHLFHLCGESDRALNLLLAAADVFYHAGLADATRSQLEAIESLFDGAASRVRVRSRKARLLLVLGHAEDARSLAIQCLSDSSPQSPSLAPERLIAAAAAFEASVRLDSGHEEVIAPLLALAANTEMAPELRQLACLSGVRLGANSQDMRVLRHFAGEASAIRAAGSPVTLAGWMTSLIAASELGSAAEIRSTLDSLPLALLGSASVADQCHVERVACLAERIVGNLNGAAERGQRGFQLAMEYGLAHQARVAADSLAFLFMDYCRLEEAEHWIRIGSGLAGASKFGITLRSTDHAFDRLLLQQGRCEELLRRVESRPPNLHAAVRSPNRLGELSLAAYAFSANGDVTRATAYAQRVIGSLHDELGQLAHHFPVELASRALRNVGQPDEADALSRKHRDSYFSMGRPPLPPFFVEISQGSA